MFERKNIDEITQFYDSQILERKVKIVKQSRSLETAHRYNKEPTNPIIALHFLQPPK